MNGQLTTATGRAEGEAAFAMVRDVEGRHRITVGGARGFGDAGYVDSLRSLNATPHVAQKQRSAIDERTTRHAGYAISQRVRKRVEEVFGWLTWKCSDLI